MHYTSCIHFWDKKRSKILCYRVYANESSHITTRKSEVTCGACRMSHLKLKGPAKKKSKQIASVYLGHTMPRAAKRARELNLSLGRYLARLVERDLAQSK